MSTEQGADNPGIAVGRQIRVLRQQRELSMQALAELASVSRAWLGEIERGAASPSVDVVRRLANALGVPVGALLDGQASKALLAPPDRFLPTHLIRRGRRPILRFPSQLFAWEVLTPLKGELQLMSADMDPSDAPIELMSHGGQESVLILKGQLNVVVDADEVVLHEGDCITFAADLAHGFMNRGPGITRMLNATAPPSIGELAH